MTTKYSKKAKSSKTQSGISVEDEEIDEIMENIDLKRPRSAYTHFCLDEIEKYKNKNKGKKIDL